MKKTINTRLPLYTIFFLYLFIFSLWFVFRYFTHFPEIIDELVAKPVIWILPVVLFSLMYKKNVFSRKQFTLPRFSILVLSVFTGIFLALLQVAPNILKWHAVFHIPEGVISLIFATLGTAVYEETLFRGLFFPQLSKHFSLLIAQLITSILFVLMHLPILIFITHTAHVQLLVAMYIIFVSSITFGLLSYYSKTLWSPIISHYIFDVLLSFF